jgi:hypothetical protein
MKASSSPKRIGSVAEMNEEVKHTLISSREALKILTWVSYHGLYRGCKGTNKLTRFPHGTFSKEECEALRDEFIERGFAAKEQINGNARPVPSELV